MCGIEFADPWDFVHEETRNAGKSHRCAECGRTIERGESHHYLTGVCDGYWTSIRTCAHCKAAGTWMDTVCGGYLTEGLREELTEHWEDGYRSVGLGRLIVGVRRRWHDGRDPIPDSTEVRALAKRMLEATVA